MTKPAPRVIHVSFCTGCGNPSIAERKNFRADRQSCPVCPIGTGYMLVARYQLAPPKTRDGRKPVKRWKRERSKRG